MHKDMKRKKKSETSIVGPNKDTATTQDQLQLNRQHFDCLHNLFFHFLLLLPSQTRRVMDKKKNKKQPKTKQKATTPTSEKP